MYCVMAGFYKDFHVKSAVDHMHPLDMFLDKELHLKGDCVSCDFVENLTKVLQKEVATYGSET